MIFMNYKEIMDKAIKEAKKASEVVKLKTNSYAEADRQKIKKIAELTTGFLEAIIKLSWQKNPDSQEGLRSEIASSMQIIEKAEKESSEKIKETKSYKITGEEVKKFIARTDSVLRKINFAGLDNLLK